MRVGFAGLGSMGSAMVGRLLDSGAEVVVWNRTPDRAAGLVDRGAVLAEAVGDLFDADVVVSMLANDAAVSAAFSEELLRSLPVGRLHVNMATISVSAARAMVVRHRDAGVAYLSAPVLGRPPAAEAGQLTILAAGPDESMRRAEPVLGLLGKRTWYFGSTHDRANLVKISMNYLLIHSLQAMAESITLVEAAGVDPSEFIELASSSFFPGPVYSTYGNLMANRQYTPPAFTTQLGLKDLGLAEDAAKALGVNLPLGDGLRDIFTSALASGLADSDWASIAEVTRSKTRPIAR